MELKLQKDQILAELSKLALNENHTVRDRINALNILLGEANTATDIGTSKDDLKDLFKRPNTLTAVK